MRAPLLNSPHQTPPPHGRLGADGLAPCAALPRLPHTGRKIRSWITDFDHGLVTLGWGFNHRQRHEVITKIIIPFIFIVHKGHIN